MVRAITTGVWTLLLLSTIYAQSVPPRVRGRSNVPTAGPSAPPAAAQATEAALQPAQPAPSMLQQPAREAQIVFGNNNLSIRADNSSLSAILRQIGASSGMKIEGLSNDERVFGNFGPGAPRDVLADLLDGTAYNLVLLGDLSNGAPRELILTPATRGGVAAPAPAPQVSPDDAVNDQESAEVPPPLQPEVPPAATTPPPTPGVRTPQQLFEQLQHMRQTQQQQQQQPPVQQDDTRQ